MSSEDSQTRASPFADIESKNTNPLLSEETEYYETSNEIHFKSQKISSKIHDFYAEKGLTSFIKSLPRDDHQDFEMVYDPKFKLTWKQKLFGIPPRVFFKEKLCSLFEIYRIGRFSAIYGAYFHSFGLETFYMLCVSIFAMIYYFIADGINSGGNVIPVCYESYQKLKDEDEKKI